MLTYTDSYGEVKGEALQTALGGYSPTPMHPIQQVPIPGRWVIHAFTRITSCDRFDTGWMSGMGPRKLAVMIDNHGQTYVGDIPVSVPNGFRLQMWYSPDAALAIKSPLADQVIDVIKKIIGGGDFYSGKLLEPLLQLIETLQNEPHATVTGVNMNTQTNMNDTRLQVNAGIQANGRNGFVNTLRKTCSGKNCNAANMGVQTNMNHNTNANRKPRNGFVNTLRKTCRGKNCNAANTGVQTNAAAYTGRRHSMVNALRRTVKSTRPNTNTP
jgi:hypothetical protein